MFLWHCIVLATEIYETKAILLIIKRGIQVYKTCQTKIIKYSKRFIHMCINVYICAQLCPNTNNDSVTTLLLPSFKFDFSRTGQT